MALRVGNFLQKFRKDLAVIPIRFAHIIADGRGPCNEQLNSCYKVNFQNLQCEIPLEKLGRKTLSKYQFPTLTLKYSAEDCVQHALSVGVDESHPNANNLLNKDSDLEVLPSFHLVLGNKIFLHLADFDLMFKDSTVHGEQFINIYQPLKPEGEITYKLSVVDIIDKVNGTLYIYNLHGHDEMNKEVFQLEYQFYEIGTKNVGKRVTGFKCEKTISPPNRVPDKIFLFKTTELSSTFFNPTSTDKLESLFSVNHPTQHCALTEKFSSQPNCHGRYYLGAVMQQILGYYANGNAKLFQRVKTRFSHPVYPGNTLLTKSWKINNRIHFETFVNESGKCVLQGSYLDLKN